MKKVLVGMSGGVDSSVAALLLKEQNYEVIGATIVLFNEDNKNSSILDDSKKICEKLEIKHYEVNLKEEFKKRVIDNFIVSYKNGLTPNPCVLCNKYLKFGALWDKAKELGCDFIATGHYVKQKDGKLMISSSKDKDQSYFLYGINKEVIPHIIFPLEGFSCKEEIRLIAKKNNLFVAGKKDSQEICFIPNNDYATFLENNLDELPNKGDFIDKNGMVLGKHKGIIYYTIGQRKGLGISASKPLYVIEINPGNNTITLGFEEDLYKNELVCTDLNLLTKKLPNNVYAKIRFRANLAKATLEMLDNGDVKVVFQEPQRAITKGQSVVFYNDGVVLGGGVIK